MSPNLKTFYRSACMPVLVLSLCSVSFPAKAAFEWTPPEAVEPPPISSSGSALPEAEPSPPPAGPAVDMLPELPVDGDAGLSGDEAVPETSPYSGPVMKTRVMGHEEDTTAQETDPAPVSVETPSGNAGDGLTINPFPLQNGAAEAPAAESMPVLLPMEGDEAAMPEEPAHVAPPVETVVAPPHIAPPQDFAVVEGFGSDMPLALALSQIVPPHYAFSFGNGVNPGIRVSWNGGKPWNEILQEMLAPFQLDVVIMEKAVVVTVKKNSPGEEASREPVPYRTGADETPSPVSGEVGALSVSQRALMTPEPADVSGDATFSGRMSDDVVAEMAAAPQEPVSEPETAAVSVPRRVIFDPGLEEAQQPQPVPEEILADPEAKLPEYPQIQPSSVAPEQEMEKIEPAAHPADSDKTMLKKIRVWEAAEGASLKEIVTRWSRETGVSLVWQSGRDYRLTSNVLISGTYENAIKVLFSKAVKGAPDYTFSAEKQGELVVRG